MSDQMPDEVWLHRRGSDFAGASPEPLHPDDVRYIRADKAETAIAALEARIASMIGDGTHKCTRCGVQYTPATGDSEDCPACGHDGGEHG